MGQARQLRADLGFDTSDRAIGDSFAVSVADAGSAEALSRQAFGVPLNKVEFAEMQRRQSMLVAQVDLGTRAEALDGFAGVFIDQPAGGVFVLRFTAKAEASAVAALVDGYRFGEFLRVETVERSLGELITIRDEAIKRMLASGRVEGREWLAEVDIRANETVLRHVDEVKVLAEEVARSTGARPEVFGGSAEEALGGIDCNENTCEPLTAGMRAPRVDGSLACTWGFTIFSNGVLRASTAGHCANTVGDLTRTMNGLQLTRDDWRNNSTEDIAIYSIPVQTLATNDLMAYSAGANRFGIQVSLARAPYVGEAVCKRGTTTDHTCGTVLTAAPGQKATANYLSCGGDSGAPVFVYANLNQRVAVGIHSAGPENPNCPPNGPIAGTRTFTTADRFAVFGASVYVTSNVRRDFIISLYSRALYRYPDAPGLTYWQGGGCAFASLGAPIVGFYTGGEFKAQSGVSDINNSSRLAQRFTRLYRGVLRRDHSIAERDSWVNWVYAQAPGYPGATLTEKREAAYNAAVSFFAGSGEFSSRFSTGYGGEIALCAN